MKKMKFFTITLLLFLILSNLSYSGTIYFTNPTNGQTVHYIYSKTQIALNLTYYRSTKPNGYFQYEKLYTHNGTYSNLGSGEIPQWWYLSPGTYTWRLELWEGPIFPGDAHKVAEQTITFYVKHTLEIRNDFNIGSSNIKIDNITEISGSESYKSIGENLTVGAIDQWYGNNFYAWIPSSEPDKSEWKRNKLNSSSGTTISYQRNYNYSVQNDDNGATIKGYLKIHQLPSTPTISISGGIGDNPTLTFSGGGPNVDHYVLKKEYDFDSGYGSPHYVDPASSPYTDNNVEITGIGGDLVARYSVKAVDNLGYESNYSNTVTTNGQSLWKNNNESIVTTYEYGIANYPNPYNPSTTINFQIKETGNVTITVYDALGREVKELVKEVKQPGSYNILFDGTNLSSGIYFYTMSVNNFTASKKMLLAK